MNEQEQASLFLRTLFEGLDGIIELRPLPIIDRCFAHRHDVPTLMDFVARHPVNLYVGVATRKPGSTTGTLEDLCQLGWVFGDFDFKIQPESVYRQRLAECPFQPNIIVHSGHGLHVYWQLREPFDFLEDEPRARQLLERLAAYFNADKSSAECVRILRVPGTINHKPKEGPDAPVVLELCERTLGVDPSELEDVFPPLPPHVAGQDFKTLEPAGEGDRHTRVFRWARSMKYGGVPAKGVLAALLVMNPDLCNPPLDEAEIHRQVDSAFTQRDRPGFAPRPIDPDEDAEPVEPAVDPRPVFPADDDLHTLIPKVREAITAWNEPPQIYNVTGVPMRMDWTPQGDPLPVELEWQHYIHVLASSTRWDRAGKKKTDPPRLPCEVPDRMVNLLRAQPATLWPELRRLVAAPFFRPDGTLIQKHGYDQSTALYYIPQAELEVPPISETPTRAERAAALHLLRWELCSDFLFRKAEEDFSNVIAAMVTPFLRPLYTGHTPLFAISKPVERAGAGLLIDAMLYPSLGRRLPRTSLPASDEEVRKSLFAFAREGRDALLFDNVASALDQSPLAAFLTSDRISDRVLGVSQTATAATLPLLYVTGIGLTYSAEIAGRICLIELDPKQEHPEQRSGFRHADLRAWCQAERGRLIWACLTLIQAAQAAGWPQPPDRTIVGDFQGWADRVGSVIFHAGLPAFMANRARLQGANPTGEAWKLLYRRILDELPGDHGSEEFTAGRVWGLTGWKREERQKTPDGDWIEDPDVFRYQGVTDVPLPLFGNREMGRSEHGMKCLFGRELTRRVGQVIEGYRLDAVSVEHQAQVYQLVDNRSEPSGGVSESSGELTPDKTPQQIPF